MDRTGFLIIWATPTPNARHIAGIELGNGKVVGIRWRASTQHCQQLRK
jgi:hypothetical protein